MDEFDRLITSAQMAEGLTQIAVMFKDSVTVLTKNGVPEAHAQEIVTAFFKGMFAEATQKSDD